MTDLTANNQVITMTETKPTPRAPGKISHRLKRVFIVTLTIACIMVVALLLANAGMNHPTGMATLRHWMNANRTAWLAWRLALYAALVFGLWKIWHAPGFKPAYRAPLLRIAVISTLFMLVCEYALLTGATS